MLACVCACTCLKLLTSLGCIFQRSKMRSPPQLSKQEAGLCMCPVCLVPYFHFFFLHHLPKFYETRTNTSTGDQFSSHHQKRPLFTRLTWSFGNCHFFFAKHEQYSTELICACVNFRIIHKKNKGSDAATQHSLPPGHACNAVNIANFLFLKREFGGTTLQREINVSFCCAPHIAQVWPAGSRPRHGQWVVKKKTTNCLLKQGNKLVRPCTAQLLPISEIGDQCNAVATQADRMIQNQS